MNVPTAPDQHQSHDWGVDGQPTKPTVNSVDCGRRR